MVGNHPLLLRPATPFKMGILEGLRLRPWNFPPKQVPHLLPTKSSMAWHAKGMWKKSQVVSPAPLVPSSPQLFSLGTQGFGFIWWQNHGDSVIRNDSHVGWLLSLGDEFKSNLQVVIRGYNPTYNSLTTIVPNYHEPPSGEKEQMDNQRSSN